MAPTTGLEIGLAQRRERSPFADFDVAAIDRVRILTAAGRYLHEEPATVTASTTSRSAGGKHDYFSEGDYWWPDPKTPDGRYIQRDGITNPDNFLGHRRALIRLSVQVPALAGGVAAHQAGALCHTRCEAPANLVR